MAAADAAWLAGDAQHALALLDDARRHMPAPAVAARIDYLRGRVAMRCGPVLDGYPLIVGAAEQIAEDDSELAVVMLAHAVHGCLYTGDTQAMIAAAERAVALASGQDRAARCRGLLADTGEMEARFEEALRLHEQTPDAFETARTRLAYGARLRRARKRIRARQELRAAIEIFEHLGAQPWADQADAELAATGETARRRDVSTLDELTPQELQTARLLADALNAPHEH